jgi:hypothetical protein
MVPSPQKLAGAPHSAQAILKVCGEGTDSSIKEDFMSARTTRVEARERIIKSFMDSLDRIIPPDESVPLRGQTFLDWEH